MRSRTDVDLRWWRASTVSIALAILLMTVLGTKSSAAVPPNDDHGQAIGVTSLPFTDRTNTDGATQDDLGCFGPGTAGTWYSYTPDQDVALIAYTLGSRSHHSLCAFTEVEGQMTIVGFDSGTGGSGRVFFQASAGTTYLIKVEQPGDLVFSLYEYFRSAANDDVEQATEIDSVGWVDGVNISSATRSPDDPPCDQVVENTVWYSFTPVSDRDVLFTTLLSVFPAPFCVYTEDLTLVASSNSSVPFQPFQYIRAHLTGGMRYYVMIGADATYSELSTFLHVLVEEAFRVSPGPISASIDRSGAVTITGSAGCQHLGFVTVDGTLQQRVNSVSFVVNVPCLEGDRAPWTATVASPTRRFAAGPASITVIYNGCYGFTYNCSSASTSRQIRVIAGRR